MSPQPGPTHKAPAMDDVFKALADPSRRQLLDTLKARSGQNLGELCAGLDMARQSVSKHLAVLEAAHLVTTTWQGREKLHYVNAAPINEIAERWINHYDQPRANALFDLKKALEEPIMATTAFVYSTYIRTTPEQLWKALTEPAFTQAYWDITFETDWQVGSPMTWVNHGVTIVDPEQKVLESDPYRRLSYTWHTFTPELGARFEMDPSLPEKMAGESRSKATFDIEEQDHGQVKLTVLHEDLDADGSLIGMITQGWPAVLSSLKSFLETGEALQ